MTKALSDKLKVGSLICTVMVVFRHSLNLRAFFGSEAPDAYCLFVETGVSKLTEMAVPYFFLVSGFFFLRHSYADVSDYGAMLRKKSRTLFVPFLFWNVVGVLPLMLAGQFQYECGAWLYVRDCLRSDWNGALWYVRDLMTYMLLVPLYGWVFAWNRKWFYVLVGLVLFRHWLPVDCSWLSSEGVLFFFLGGVLSRWNPMLRFRCPAWLAALLLAVWMVSCFVFPHCYAVHRYNHLLGLYVFWQALDYVPSAGLLRVSSYSFFIYVTHLYLLKGMKIGLARHFPGSGGVAMAAYFLLPLFSVGIALLVGRLWKRYSPRTFAWVTGGRG
ncbi:MAG: acyltransferase family protein [Bacteroidaceae bacterium]